MDTKSLLQNADISPKKAALIKHFKIVELTEKYNNDVDRVMERIGKEDIFSFEESKIIASKNKPEDVRVWSHNIRMLLNFDTTAEKYYYQTVSGIYVKRFFEDMSEQNGFIRQCYFQYLSYAFVTVTLNKVFYDLIDIVSPLYLVTIADFERGSTGNCCYLFRREYKVRKDEIIKKARGLIEEVSRNVARYEYISESQIAGFIDKTDQIFTKLLG